jgi:hypothetical protein
MKKILISAALALGAHLSAHAADDAAPVKFLLGGGLTFGGDKLATVGFSDGSTDNIRAGALLMLYGGAEVRLGDLVSFQATLGYHVDDTSPASNGKLRFSRMPVDLLLHFRLNEQLRLGAGMQLVHKPELKGSGDVSYINAKFDNATGAVLEGEYLFSPHVGLKLRYVSEEFELKGSNVTVDGSHVGLLLNYYF